ncbi:hypothetical protein [Francisella halioticida]|uniref:hypothetical protein n=1 Tax=Francisella halioticida TaxID=549298 RepID=UPI0012FA7D92|nr:hypothetical protein [Francisella halioticida]
MSTMVGIVVAIVLYLIFDQARFVFYWAFICIPVIFIVGFLPVIFTKIINNRNNIFQTHAK